MSQPVRGTVRVDICELETLLKQLKTLRDALDTQRRQICVLETRLHQAIQGTAPSIGRFDHKFAGWLDLLDRVSNDMDLTCCTLANVLEEAREHDISGILRALRHGIIH